MNFVESHIIVHNYVDATVDFMNENSLMFMPKSKINADISSIYDAFIVFLGHSVFWGTRSPKQIDDYISLTRFIEFVTDDNTYQSIVNDVILTNNTSGLLSIIKKKEIGNAQRRLSAYMELLSKCLEKSRQTLNIINYTTLVSHFISKKSDLYERSNGFFSVENIIDYVKYIYSFTSVGLNPQEDFFFFTTFEKMREDIIKKHSIFYDRYKNYIMNAN